MNKTEFQRILDSVDDMTYGQKVNLLAQLKTVSNTRHIREQYEIVTQEELDALLHTRH